MLFDLMVAATVCFAALAWGGNEPWAMAIVTSGAILALAGRLVWNSRAGRVRLWRSWAFIPLLLFLAYAGLQMLSPRTGLGLPRNILPHTVEPHTTRMYVLIALAYFALVLAVSHGFKSREQVKRLILFILVLAVFEALYGLAQSLGIYRYIWDFPVSSSIARGTFVNRNHYALMLNLGLCSGFGYLYYHSRRLPRGENFTALRVIGNPGFAKLAWIILWLALIGLALVMSLSRMGIVAMFASAAVMWIAGRRTGNGKRTAVVALSVLFAILSLALYTGIDAVLGRYQRVSEAGLLEKDRMPIWRDAFKMIQANPIVGNGLGTFQWTFGAYESFEPDVPAKYAHNNYLQMLAEVGAVGLLIIIAAFALFWGTAVKNLRHSGDPLVQGIGLATLGMLTAVALQEATDFSLYIPGVAVCFAVLMGLNLRASRMLKGQTADSYNFGTGTR